MRARIIYTFNCNRSCSYCCNKIDAVRASFKPITRQDLVQSAFDEYAITGGEPLTDPDGVFDLIKAIRTRRTKRYRVQPKIHLYTNGDLLSELIVDGYPWELVTGINIGIHEVPDYRILKYARWLSDETYVRFLIPDALKDEAFVDLCQGMGNGGIRFWKMNECLDMPEEPRFYLVD